MVVTTYAAFFERLKLLQDSHGPLVLDIETGNGTNPWDSEKPAYMIGIVLGAYDDPSTDTYFSFGHEGENIPYELIEYLVQLLRDRTWIGHNLSFDSKLLTFNGFALPERMKDTIIAAHLVNENEDSLALKELGRQYFGAEAGTEQDALKLLLKAMKLTMSDLQHTTAAQLGPYALQDIALTRRMMAFMDEMLTRWKLQELFGQVCEFALALVRMMLRGLLIDRDEIQRQMVLIGPRIEATRAEIKTLAGFDINVNSYQQLRTWLKLSKTDKKTLQDVLEREERADVRLLLEYRQLSKANSTYFIPFLRLADYNNRLHTEFNVTGTVTGRLSSKKPNLQNQSRTQDDRSFSVRSSFIAPPGHFYAEFDYSSIEPRLAVHYSNDPQMIDAFHAGLDFHRSIAQKALRKQDISKQERTDYKNLGLGILYGLGNYKSAVKLLLRHEKDANGEYVFHHRLAWRMNPETEELEKVPCSLIDREFCACAGKGHRSGYFDVWPGLKPCIQTVTEKAEAFKYIRNPLSGRVQRFPGKERRAHKAFNALIQSSAAEILRLALVAVDKHDFGPDGPRMVLTVHDSIYFEVPFGVSSYKHLQTIKHLMENVVALKVPVLVDCKIGMNMSNMGEVQL